MRPYCQKHWHNTESIWGFGTYEWTCCQKWFVFMYLFDSVSLQWSFMKRLKCHYNHRPHSRQVTGARCTGDRGSPVMSWILLKANNAQQASGVGDKRFFRFKRNVQHFWTAIIRHHVNDITHQHVMRFNQWSKFEIFFKSIWKIPSASGHSRSSFTSCRTRPSWHNGSSLGPHALNGYGSMTLATTNTIYGKSDPALVDMWGTSYQNMKYQSSLRRRVITGGSEKDVRVSRKIDCRIGVIKLYVSANN